MYRISVSYYIIMILILYYNDINFHPRDENVVPLSLALINSSLVRS